MSILIYKQRHRHPNQKKTPKCNYAHIGYIATRPGAVKNEGMRHGLFGMLAPGEIQEFDTWQKAARLVRELSENANKDIQNVAGALVPRLMIPVVLELSGIPPERKAHDVTKGERRRLLETLKGLTIPIKGPRPIAEAIITSGGIKVGEIDPKTMASKKIPGLFLAGELIDVDAYTGGFNLQIAWATGRAAGEGALLFLKEK